MKEGDIVKINPQNNGFIGWAEFLEIIRDFGKETLKNITSSIF